MLQSTSLCSGLTLSTVTGLSNSFFQTMQPRLFGVRVPACTAVFLSTLAFLLSSSLLSLLRMGLSFYCISTVLVLFGMILLLTEFSVNASWQVKSFRWNFLKISYILWSMVCPLAICNQSRMQNSNSFHLVTEFTKLRSELSSMDFSHEGSHKMSVLVTVSELVFLILNSFWPTSVFLTE